MMILGNRNRYQTFGEYNNYSISLAISMVPEAGCVDEC
jgi:hypothetical protein